MAMIVGYGSWRLTATPAVVADAPRPFAAMVVQGNHESRASWSRVQAERALTLYARVTGRALAAQPADLIVWPEYAVALYPEAEGFMRQALQAVAARTRGGLVFGAPRREGSEEREAFYNAAYHLDGDGALAFADKRQLVPFAEYRPEAFGHAVAAVGDERFTLGGASRALATQVGRLGTLICYEVTFPRLARDVVRAGAEVLVNLSNDTWLDRAGLGAGAQHLGIATFRAIETRRWLVRATTTGVSAIIDPFGRIVTRIETGTRGVTSAMVAPRRDLTPYVRWGDVFAYACLLLGVVTLLACRLRPEPA